VPSVLSGISGAQFAALNPFVFGSLSAAQTAVFNRALCGAIQQQQAANLGRNNQACQGISSDCIGLITLPSISAITSNCLSNLALPTVKAFSFNQSVALSAPALTGLTGDELLALVEVYRGPLIEGWSLSQSNSIGSPAVSKFIALVDSRIFPKSHTIPSQQALRNTTQLQIADCVPEQCISVMFGSSSAPNSLPSRSWGGLRADMVPLISKYGSLSDLTAAGSFAFWNRGAVSALNGAQIAAISTAGSPSSPAAFEGLNTAWITPSAFAGVTDKQLDLMAQFGALQLPCRQFDALTAAQMQYIQSKWSESYEWMQYNCGEAISSSTGAVQSSTGSPVPPESSTGSAPAPSPGGLSTAAKIGIACGCGAAGILIIVGLRFWWKRRNRWKRDQAALDEALLQ
jgi:hypothetical protein